MPHNITKNDSIRKQQDLYDTILDRKKTHFANVNSRKLVWWIEIPLIKFTSGEYQELDILVFEGGLNILHHLRVPTNYIKDNLPMFYVRKDKESISLELSVDNRNKFEDIRPKSGKMQFSQFLIRSFNI